MGALDDWYESLDDDEQERVRRAMLGPSEPEQEPTPTARVARALDEGPDPDQVRRDRRNK